MPYRVTDVQPTPNPNAAKFILDRPISEQTMSFFNAAAAGGNELAKRLFAVPGVSSLMFCGDFITVNKAPDAAWRDLTGAIERVLSAG